MNRRGPTRSPSRFAFLGTGAGAATSRLRRGCDLTPTATVDHFSGLLNNRLFAAAADARVTDISTGRASLAVFATRAGNSTTGDILIGIFVPITGLGRYAIQPEDMRLTELVGGDVIVGSCVGTPGMTGTITVTEYGGPGEPFSAELERPLTHANGASSFGAAALFRVGHVHVAHVRGPFVPANALQ